MRASLRPLLQVFVVVALAMSVFGYIGFNISLKEFHQLQQDRLTETLDTAIVQAGRSLKQNPERAGEALTELAADYHNSGTTLLVVSPKGEIFNSPTDGMALITGSISVTGQPDQGIGELDGQHLFWMRRPVPGSSWKLLLAQVEGDTITAHLEGSVLPLFLVGIIVSLLAAAIWMGGNAFQRRFRYDPVVQLPNRAYLRHVFDSMARQAHRNNRTMALCVLDVSRFKEINNTLGYPLGNRVLRMIGANINNDIRGGDFVAHLGGDRFAVLLQNVDVQNYRHFAERTLASLKTPITISGIELQVSACAGFAIYPDHDSDADNLIQKAEIAMYQGKTLGRESSIYTVDADSHSLVRLGLLGELRQALQNDDLELWFQPKIDLSSGRVCGLESLLRWPHHDMGIIPPSEFIPLAEKSGMISTLSRWVLDKATDECLNWSFLREGLPIAVNLSARDLLDTRLPGFIRDMLREKNLSPNLLCVEITESELMVDPIIAGQVIRELHQLGVGISIDDFGTGYSSLSHLRKLPFDEIKIDRSFVRDLANNENDQAIVRTLIELGRNLGLKVVAEGIESAICLDMLKQMGCDIAQGFYISHPLASQELAYWLHHSPHGLLSSSGVVPLHPTGRGA